jgi:hypothetical protein
VLEVLVAHVVERNRGQVEVGVTQEAQELLLLHVLGLLVVMQVLDGLVQLVVVHIQIKRFLAQGLLDEELLVLYTLLFLAVLEVGIAVGTLAALVTEFFNVLLQEVPHLGHVLGVVVITEFLLLRLAQQFAHADLPVVISAHIIKDVFPFFWPDKVVDFISLQVLIKLVDG